MPDSWKVSWFAAHDDGQWHKVLAWVRWGDDNPWSAMTACHRPMTEKDLGRDGVLDPPKDKRYRRCEVAEIVGRIGRETRR